MHYLNSDGTGDLSLLRYKPDFITSLFLINELYCISEYQIQATLVYSLKKKSKILQILHLAIYQLICNIHVCTAS